MKQKSLFFTTFLKRNNPFRKVSLINTNIKINRVAFKNIIFMIFLQISTRFSGKD